MNKVTRQEYINRLDEISDGRFHELKIDTMLIEMEGEGIEFGITTDGVRAPQLLYDNWIGLKKVEDE